MDESVLLSANVFFIVSSIAAVVFVMGFGVLLFYLVPLARDASDMMDKFSAAAEEVENEYEKIRDVVEEEGTKGKAILDLLLGFIGSALHTPPKRRKRLRKKSS